MKYIDIFDREMGMILYALESKANEYGQRAVKYGDEPKVQIDLWNMQASYLGLVESLKHRFYDDDCAD